MKTRKENCTRRTASLGW